MGQIEVETQVQQIEQTEDRLAAAVEALAYKKAHLKEEAIGVAQVKADELLEKAEEAKDQLVAKISEKIPDRRELKQTAGELISKAADTAADAGQEIRHEAGEIAGKVVDAVEHTVEHGKQAAVQGLHRVTQRNEPEAETRD